MLLSTKRDAPTIVHFSLPVPDAHQVQLADVQDE